MAEIEAIVKEKFPRLKLIGSAYHGVGVADCVALAERVSLDVIRGYQTPADGAGTAEPGAEAPKPAAD